MSYNPPLAPYHSRALRLTCGIRIQYMGFHAVFSSLCVHIRESARDHSSNLDLFLLLPEPSQGQAWSSSVLLDYDGGRKARAQGHELSRMWVTLISPKQPVKVFASIPGIQWWTQPATVVWELAQFRVQRLRTHITKHGKTSDYLHDLRKVFYLSGFSYLPSEGVRPFQFRMLCVADTVPFTAYMENMS